MDYNQLSELEHLRSLASQRELARIQSREASLRQQLNAIRAYRTEAGSADPTLRSMRAIGADVLWNRWLDQTQTVLNTSLARTLVEKEKVLHKVRRAVSRSDTVDALRARAGASAALEERRAGEEKLVALSVMQHITGPTQH